MPNAPTLHCLAFQLLQNAGNGGGAARQVALLQVQCWPNRHRVPESTHGFLELVKMADDWSAKLGNSNSPVLVMSRDGVSRAGPYCVISMSMERLISEGELDIFRAVEKVKKNRPQLVENVMEYIYCYTCAVVLVEFYLQGHLKPISIDEVNEYYMLVDESARAKDQSRVIPLLHHPPSGLSLSPSAPPHQQRCSSLWPKPLQTDNCLPLPELWKSSDLTENIQTRKHRPETISNNISEHKTGHQRGKSLEQVSSPTQQQERQPREIRSAGHQRGKSSEQVSSPTQQQERQPRETRSAGHQRGKSTERVSSPTVQQERHPRETRSAGHQRGKSKERVSSPTVQQERQPREIRSAGHQKGKSTERVSSPIVQQERQPRETRSAGHQRGRSADNIRERRHLQKQKQVTRDENDITVYHSSNQAPTTNRTKTRSNGVINPQRRPKPLKPRHSAPVFTNLPDSASTIPKLPPLTPPCTSALSSLPSVLDGRKSVPVTIMGTTTRSSYV